MSRLIDEDAAINAIEKTYGMISYHEDGFTRGDAIDIIKALPSAQTEQKWIPCSERLPEDGTWNIFTDGKNISVERYKQDAIDHFFPSGRWFELEDAVAWMPLPKPYQAERREDG